MLDPGLLANVVRLTLERSGPTAYIRNRYEQQIFKSKFYYQALYVNGAFTT